MKVNIFTWSKNNRIKTYFWLGIDLTTPNGDNDGSLKGCEMKIIKVIIYLKHI